MGSELSNEYYNKVFKEGGCRQIYFKSYTETVWAPVWNRIGHLIKENDKIKKILDLGCGPGQLAECLLKYELDQYLGLDFSNIAVNFAKQRLQNYDISLTKNFNFEIKDLAKTDLKEIDYDYNIVVTTEFLEHIHGDLKIISSLKPKTKIYATFPDEDADGHVRFYSSSYETACKQITERYGNLCDFIQIEEWPYFNNTKRDYLAVMVKK